MSWHLYRYHNFPFISVVSVSSCSSLSLLYSHAFFVDVSKLDSWINTFWKFLVYYLAHLQVFIYILELHYTFLLSHPLVYISRTLFKFIFAFVDYIFFVSLSSPYSYIHFLSFCILLYSFMSISSSVFLHPSFLFFVFSHLLLNHSFCHFPLILYYGTYFRTILINS